MLAKDQTRKYILVCDDVPDNADMIQILLEEEGYVIDVSHTGKDTIDTLQQKKYDLLILNMFLPDMTGYDVVSYIKENLKIKIPILFFTGVDEVITTDENVLGVITKPIDFDIFKQKVKGVLG